MTPKEFAKFLKRDQYCLHCGRQDETLIPQHRANRGSGGSKKRDVPSNIIVLCSSANFLLESNPGFAEAGRRYGWKLSTWSNPLFEPVYDAVRGCWWRLDDKFGRVVVEPEE